MPSRRSGVVPCGRHRRLAAACDRRPRGLSPHRPRCPRRPRVPVALTSDLSGEAQVQTPQTTGRGWGRAGQRPAQARRPGPRARAGGRCGDPAPGRRAGGVGTAVGRGSRVLPGDSGQRRRGRQREPRGFPRHRCRLRGPLPAPVMGPSSYPREGRGSPRAASGRAVRRCCPPGGRSSPPPERPGPAGAPARPVLGGKDARPLPPGGVCLWPLAPREPGGTGTSRNEPGQAGLSRGL